MDLITNPNAEAIMKQPAFEREMRQAKTMVEIGDRPEFWAGYQRGLRRRYHGEKFGTEAEHKLWISLAQEKPDQPRHERGVGYRAGYYCGELGR